LGLTTNSFAQDEKTAKVTCLKYDFSSGQKEKYSGYIKYILKDDGFGKSYINITWYKIYGIENGSDYLPGSNNVPIKYWKEKKIIGGIEYEYFFPLTTGEELYFNID
jgi:hypothetical protein